MARFYLCEGAPDKLVGSAEQGAARAFVCQRRMSPPELAKLRLAKGGQLDLVECFEPSRKVLPQNASYDKAIACGELKLVDGMVEASSLEEARAMFRGDLEAKEAEHLKPVKKQSAPLPGGLKKLMKQRAPAKAKPRKPAKPPEDKAKAAAEAKAKAEAEAKAKAEAKAEAKAKAKDGK